MIGVLSVLLENKAKQGGWLFPHKTTSAARGSGRVAVGEMVAYAYRSEAQASRPPSKITST